MKQLALSAWRRPAVSAVVGLFAGVPGAFAQGAESGALPAVQVGGKSTRRSTLDSPSSTASRLGLSPRETPASIDVIDSAAMEQRGVRTLEEALSGAAGLSVGGSPGSPGIASSRGFTGGYITYLYDGARISVPTMSTRPQDSWNYERVEVLKGPASVLYGEGGIGGAVNFFPKRADRANTGSQALLALGSYGALRAAAGTGGALGESGAYRVDFSHQRSDGWRQRTGQRLHHLTSSAALRPSSALRLEFSADWMKDDLQADYGVPLVPASFAKSPTSVVSDAAGRVIDRRMLKTNYNVGDGVMDADSLWLRFKLGWDLAPGWQLRNELSHYRADRLWRNAESYSFAAPDLVQRTQSLVSHDHTVWGDRLDLSHQGTLLGLTHRVVVGTEFSRTDFGSQRRFTDGSPTTLAALRVDALRPVAGFYNDDPALFTGAGNRTDVSADVVNVALFAEDALKLTRDWTLVTGLRTERIRLTRTIDDLNTRSTSQFRATYRPDSFRLGTIYDWSPETALFAQAVNAAAPVGSSNLLLQSAANAAFPLTKGKQFEVGLKQSLAAARLEWTASIYRIRQSNVLSRDPDNVAVTVNNGQMSSRGAELSATWRATPSLTVSGNAALVDAQFDSLVEAGGSRVGRRPPLVPKQTARLWADLRLPQWPVSLGAAWAYTGDMFTDNANTIRIRAASRVDVHAHWRLPSVLLGLRVRNVTDKLYATWTGANTSQVVLAPPRTVELSAKLDF